MESPTAARSSMAGVVCGGAERNTVSSAGALRIVAQQQANLGNELQASLSPRVPGSTTLTSVAASTAPIATPSSVPPAAPRRPSARRAAATAAAAALMAAKPLEVDSCGASASLGAEECHAAGGSQPSSCCRPMFVAYSVESRAQSEAESGMTTPRKPLLLSAALPSAAAVESSLGSLRQPLLLSPAQPQTAVAESGLGTPRHPPLLSSAQLQAAVSESGLSTPCYPSVPAAAQFQVDSGLTTPLNPLLLSAAQPPAVVAESSLGSLREPIESGVSTPHNPPVLAAPQSQAELGVSTPGRSRQSPSSQLADTCRSAQSCNIRRTGASRPQSWAELSLFYAPAESPRQPPVAQISLVPRPASVRKPMTEEPEYLSSPLDNRGGQPAQEAPLFTKKGCGQFSPRLSDGSQACPAEQPLFARKAPGLCSTRQSSMDGRASARAGRASSAAVAPPSPARPREASPQPDNWCNTNTPEQPLFGRKARGAFSPARNAALLPQARQATTRRIEAASAERALFAKKAPGVCRRPAQIRFETPNRSHAEASPVRPQRTPEVAIRCQSASPERPMFTRKAQGLCSPRTAAGTCLPPWATREPPTPVRQAHHC